MRSRMKPIGISIALCGLLLMLLAISSVSYGQAVAIANVTGRVIDPRGAVVPGVKVKLTATETDAVRSATTNSDGLYTFINLPAGACTLGIRLEGNLLRRYWYAG